MHTGTDLYHLLQYLRDRDSDGWLCATLVSKQRSSYRQPGAMMLINPHGQSQGLLSGGCLEADIRLNARKVMAYGEPRCVLYDTTEDGNIAAELGLGCNGRVEVLIQPLQAAHRQLLLQLLDRMETGKSSYLVHCFASDHSEDLNALALLDENAELISSATSLPCPQIEDPGKHQLIADSQRQWSANRHDRPVNLWVFGGGSDARPLTSMASMLGWQVTLIDHRAAYARTADFPNVSQILRSKPTDELTIDADAAILMTHNLALDAAWLARLTECPALKYIGLLGPFDRRDQVLELAGIEQDSSLLSILHGPMGFDIGGDIPESVALSTLAQCHQCLFQQDSRHKR